MDDTVIGPLHTQKASLKPVYDFELMLGSGHLKGYSVDNPVLEKQVIDALKHLADPKLFHSKYGVSKEKDVLLFAMGDGNHSLATAKAIWEKIKSTVGMDHPARYALVEIENVHDTGLEFEPIHRVLFNVKKDCLASIQEYFGVNYQFSSCASKEEMVKTVSSQKGPEQKIGCVSSQGFGIITISNAPSNLPVGTLQGFLDAWLKQGGAEKIDYVHGADVTCELGSQPGNFGFFLPAMPKSDLFKTVILDGALPRKTFSMGEAKEKRFYMESRKIA
jgi:hypothetical protein